MPLWQPMDAIARPSYYDRDPYPVFMLYQAAPGPHGATVRATYTPPSGYACIMESKLTLLIRQVASPGAASAEVVWRFLPFYGGTNIMELWPQLSNVVGNVLQVAGNAHGYMAYGDALTVTSADFSAGGFVYFSLSQKGTEFLY